MTKSERLTTGRTMLVIISPWCARRVSRRTVRVVSTPYGPGHFIPYFTWDKVCWRLAETLCCNWIHIQSVSCSFYEQVVKGGHTMRQPLSV